MVEMLKLHLLFNDIQSQNSLIILYFEYKSFVPTHPVDMARVVYYYSLSEYRYKDQYKEQSRGKNINEATGTLQVAEVNNPLERYPRVYSFYIYY